MNTILELIIKYGSYIASALAFIIPLVVALIKAKKDSKLKDTVSSVLLNIPVLVIKAEKLYGSGNGEQKLDYVLTQLRLLAYENAFQLDEEEATAEIEALISATKVVNTVITNTTNKEVKA